MNSSIQNSTAELGGLEFFRINITDYLPYTILNLFGIFLGTIGIR